jgi:hypothetical protein
MMAGELEQEFLAVHPSYPAYTSDNCQLVARQRQAVNSLNCSLIYFPPVPGTRFCSPLQTTKLYTNTKFVYSPWVPVKCGKLLKVLSSEMDPVEIRLIR